MFRVVAVTAIFALAACATPYERTGLMGGYDEIQLNETTYKVFARGNGYTSTQRVEEIVLLRAAELAINKGYSHFLVVGGNGINSQTKFAGFTSGTATTDYNVYSSSSTTVYSPGQPIYNTRSSGEIVIQFVTEDHPLYAQAYDAVLLSRQLRITLDVDD